MKGSIYVITNKVNGKQYVGQTISDPRYRYSKHKSDAFKRSSNTAIHTAMRKYGEENFFMSVLETCDIKEINERETFWITKLNTYDKGYNRLLSSNTDHKDYNLVLKRFQKGETITDIAKDLHSCRKSISRILELEGIEDTHKNQFYKPITEHKKEEIIKLYKEGYSIRRISKELKSCRKTIGKVLREEGLIVKEGPNNLYHHPYKPPLNPENSGKTRKDNPEPSHSVEGATTNPDECRGVDLSESKNWA